MKLKKFFGIVYNQDERDLNAHKQQDRFVYILVDKLNWIECGFCVFEQNLSSQSH